MERTTDPEWVYILTNPRHLGWFKIGKTINPQRRLAQYQTGDPSRAFRFVLTHPVENCSLAEEALMQRLTALGYLPHGEWFEIPLVTLYREVVKLK